MNGYTPADVTANRQHRRQILSPPPSETFHRPTNFSAPQTLPDLHAQQSFLFPLFGDNQEQQLQQQQLSGMVADPFASAKFGDANGIGQVTGNFSLAGFTGADNNDIAASTYLSPSSAPFWDSGSNGMPDQQTQKFERIGTGMPDYQRQAPELDYERGSSAEIYECRHLPNPNSISLTALKCNAEDEYEKKLDRQLKAMAQSFGNQILAHQERLYERFTAKIEELERKRNEREESRRIAEAEKAQAQAEARAREQAAVASREAILFSYLEKITGGQIQLPFAGGGRWPAEEVDALIKVKTDIESRFQEPESKKSPPWDEISSEMAKLGFQRDAKRCKEKWKNITKYYERTKKEEEDEDGCSVKKRRRNKTCGYLDKLNQLYSNGGSKDSSNVDSYSNDNADQGDVDENQVQMPSESKSEEIAIQVSKIAD